MSSPLEIVDTDSEDELPAGWEPRVTDEGKVYYICHHSRHTQWAHPKSGRNKKVSVDLPYGWKKEVDSSGQVNFINPLTSKSSTVDPRLAFILDDTGNATSYDVRQRFDASSTALQVLQGRDLTGKYVIVTGANSGIGYETARSLALHGAHVTLACRDMKKANDAKKALMSERSALSVRTLYVDLTRLSTVKEFADNYMALNIPLHILVLNAGVFSLPYQVTADGYETIFQTNHLGHFHLAQLLTGLLVKSAPSRVITVSSEAHRFTDLQESTVSEALLSPRSESGYCALFAYNASKLCNVLHAMELHRRLSARGVSVFAVHPGNMISTGLSRYWWLYRLLFTLVRPFAKSKQQGAATTVYCATATELGNVSGYYFNNCFKCAPSDEAMRTDTAQRLWDLSEHLVAKARTLCEGTAEGGGVRQKCGRESLRLDVVKVEEV